MQQDHNTWEVAFVDKATNYILQDHLGAVLHGEVRDPADETEPVRTTMAALLLEARHIELGVTVRFMFRFGRNQLRQLRALVDEMDDHADDTSEQFPL